MTPFDAAPLVRNIIAEVVALRPIDRAQDTSEFLARHSAIVTALVTLASSFEAAGRTHADARALADRVFGSRLPPDGRSKPKLKQIGDVHYDARGRATVLLRKV